MVYSAKSVMLKVTIYMCMNQILQIYQVLQRKPIIGDLLKRHIIENVLKKSMIRLQIKQLIILKIKLICFIRTKESKILIAKRDITVYKVGCFADEVRFYSYFTTTKQQKLRQMKNAKDALLSLVVVVRLFQGIVVLHIELMVQV